MPKPLPTAFFNGNFMPLDQVRISPLDRGFLFADGVYEVIPVYQGKPFWLDAHLTRLQHSLDGIRLRNPHSNDEWAAIINDLIICNDYDNQAVYLQITRGADTLRDHAFPANTDATVFLMSSPLKAVAEAEREKGVAAITVADIRWQRCDIKSIALLPNILAKQEAADTNAAEAILLHNGTVREGAATTVFIVQDNAVITPPLGPEVLPGITRSVILQLAAENNVPVREEKPIVDMLFTADEIWLASSTRELTAVTQLDGKPVGNGKPGPLWHAMYDWFQTLKQSL